MANFLLFSELSFQQCLLWILACKRIIDGLIQIRVHLIKQAQVHRRAFLLLVN